MSNIVLDRDFKDAFARIIELRKKVINEEEFTPEDANDYKCIAELLGFGMMDSISTEVLRAHGQTIEGHWGYCTVDAKSKAKLSSQFGAAFPMLLRNTQRGLIREILDSTPSFSAVKKYNSKEALKAAGIQSKLTGHDTIDIDGKHIVYSYEEEATPSVEAHPY